MPFHVPLRLHGECRHTGIGRLRWLVTVALSGMLLWAFFCTAAHAEAAEPAAHPVSASHDADTHSTHGPHPHRGPDCASHAVDQVPPQAKKAPTTTAALTSIPDTPGAAASGAVLLPLSVRIGARRIRIRRPGRSRLSALCRLRI